MDLHRDLAEERTDAFSVGLAASLHKMSVHFLNLGRQEEALAVIHEAVDLHSALAAERSLNNMWNCLSNLSRQDEALAAMHEALSLQDEI